MNHSTRLWRASIGPIAAGSLVALAAAVPLAAGPAAAAANTSVLGRNEQLNPGEGLISGNGWYTLMMQRDGNLVQYAAGGKPVWSTGTNRDGSIVKMQDDGNLVVIAPDNVPVWSSRTAGSSQATLNLQNDGNAVVYSRSSVARWATGVPKPAHPYPNSFNPGAAARWAVANVRSIAADQATGNPCAQFVSRSLHAGGLPYDHDRGWYPSTEATAVDTYVNGGSSTTAQWFGVQGLLQYLRDKGWVNQYLLYPGTTVLPVSVGDLVYYEWTGQATASHVHLAIVTGVSNGAITVSDQNGESNIGVANRRWDVSGAPTTTGQLLTNTQPRMRAYVIHWR